MTPPQPAAQPAKTPQSARPVVGRFAPTPSGRMHLGNAYAMLAAWLSARSAGARSGTGSRMILRIEDIDAPRVVKDADRWIMDDLNWLGLDWDGEPVYQSARLDRYAKALDALRERRPGLIYPCFCSRADIRAASAPNEGDGYVVYPGTCRRLLEADPQEVSRRLAAGDRHSWRIAMPEATGSSEGAALLQAPEAPDEPDVSDEPVADDRIVFVDRVFGPQHYSLSRDVGDTVVRRSDGLFAYQLAVTVDDLDMGVTDIVRGRDLLRSTALQLYIRDRLTDGEAPANLATVPPRPAFAHLPLIDNAQGRRMAKREHSLDLGFLRAQGVKPEQVIGYCAWMLGIAGGDGIGGACAGGGNAGSDGIGGPGAPAGPANPARPEPMTAREALAAFDWSKVRRDLRDRMVPDHPFGPEPMREPVVEPASESAPRPA